jgi:homoserine dehydrogenase
MTASAHPLVEPAVSAVPDTYCTSGTSPTLTLHLIGPGAVGRALLERLDRCAFRLIGVSDSTATAFRRRGLDAAAVARHKQRGDSLRGRADAEPLPLDLAIDLVAADVVVDAAPSGPSHATAALQRARAVLARGGALVLAAKDALRLGAAELLEHRGRVGINAALGGTGLLLRTELHELRAGCDEVQLVANAATTAVIAGIERGLDRQQAIAQAQERGLLEPDPELDLDGSDASSKLAIVAGALWGRVEAPDSWTVPHLLELDPDLLRHRAQRGQTTRLVAHATRGGERGLAYRELRLGSPFAVPADRVAYGYWCGGPLRLHVGTGLGAAGTAGALLEDLAELRRCKAQGGGR